MNNKIQPALIAGATLSVIGIVIGLLTTLMRTPGEQPSPALGFATGCLTCLLAIGAGAFAVYLYVQRSATRATTGDGAVLGLLTGLVSAIISLLFSPVSYYLNREALGLQSEQLRQQSNVDLSPFTLLLMGLGIGILVSPLITMLGGLLGVPLFEKRKGDAGMPPPPPPGFGGGSPMGGAPTGTPGDFSR